MTASNRTVADARTTAEALEAHPLSHPFDPIVFMGRTHDLCRELVQRDGEWDACRRPESEHHGAIRRPGILRRLGTAFMSWLRP